MMKTFILLALLVLAACSDDLQQVDQNGVPLPDGVTKDGDTFTDKEGRTCTDLTPCKNCDETCKPAGNPFATENNGTANNTNGSG